MIRHPPNTLFFVGNGIKFLQNRHKLFSWFTKCEQIFGYETFEISVPSLPPGVVIGDPKNLEFVLKNEDIFTKGDFFKRRSWDLFGMVFELWSSFGRKLTEFRKWNHQYRWKYVESSKKGWIALLKLIQSENFDRICSANVPGGNHQKTRKCF